MFNLAGTESYNDAEGNIRKEEGNAIRRELIHLKTYLMNLNNPNGTFNKEGNIIKVISGTIHNRSSKTLLLICLTPTSTAKDSLELAVKAYKAEIHSKIATKLFPKLLVSSGAQTSPVASTSAAPSTAFTASTASTASTATTSVETEFSAFELYDSEEDCIVKKIDRVR